MSGHPDRQRRQAAPARRARPSPRPAPGEAARRVALEALTRIDVEGAYANLVVPVVLGRHSELDGRDRDFVTALVYGTTRMRRACDWLVDRFVDRRLDPPTRAALRLGAFQLAFLGTPPHAAVGATAGAAPDRSRTLVNAVLRKVAGAVAAGSLAWPDDATRLSYPDWIVARLVADLGPLEARAALETMDEPATVTERPDGYVQDPASTWVAEAVAARPGERVLDVCAAPGGKATAMAATGAWVVAADANQARTGLVRANADRLGVSPRVAVVVADGARPPFADACFDRVLVDAPCSGLGALRRRADARWRVEEADVERLVGIQRRLLDAAVRLVRPGGLLVYSVCTLTDAESVGVAEAFASGRGDLVPGAPPPAPWRPLGTGARLLPHDAATDGMCVFAWRRRPGGFAGGSAG
ncbi:MAG: methyltransferase domain-containing protein [Actinobacteria bacterium]|nr:methyltransferase domain-containing protein [Actinomycetota bacterium]